MNEKTKGMGKRLMAGVLALSIVVSLASCGEEKPVVSPGKEEGSAALPTVSVKSGKVSHEELLKSLQEAKAINDKTVAYLDVPGTNIQEPVIHNADEDNDYYIDMTLEGKKANASYHNPVHTVVYAAQNTDFNPDYKSASNNYVLFGHNWTNIAKGGSDYVIGNDPDYTMFGQLPSFSDEEFATNHPYLYLSTEDNEMIFKVFAVVLAEEDWSKDLGFNYISSKLSSSEASAYAAECMERSKWIYDGVDATSTDIFLTLSTCTRELDIGDQQRFIVVGRLLREGEDDKPDTVKVMENITVKEPQM